jgi:hypothetical protein
MIVTEFYDGQGLGNQLWTYATLRSIAKANNFEWEIQSSGRFKDSKFMNINVGKRVIGISSNGPYASKPFGIRYYSKEKAIIHKLEKYDISEHGPRVFSIWDRTKIDGYFQCEGYIEPIRSLLLQEFKAKSKVEFFSEIICLIHMRGGDFAPHPTLLLGRKYYNDAIAHIRAINPSVIFLVVTNDVSLAREYFPQFEIISNYKEGEIESGPHINHDHRIGDDFYRLQNTEYLILSNSSYSWWSAWKNLKVKFVVAPKYWARHNANNGFWSTGDILTKNWHYLDTEGNIHSSAEHDKETHNFRQSDIYKECTIALPEN